MVNAVAKGSVQGLTTVKNVSSEIDVSEMLKEVTVAVTSALTDVQTNLAASGITDFDAAAAKTAAESQVESAAKDPAILQDLGISESDVDSSITQAQSEVVLTVIAPTFSPAEASTFALGNSINITPSSLTSGSLICYTINGSTPACNTDMTGCDTGIDYNSNPGLSISTPQRSRLLVARMVIQSLRYLQLFTGS